MRQTNKQDSCMVLNLSVQSLFIWFCCWGEFKLLQLLDVCHSNRVKETD